MVPCSACLWRCLRALVRDVPLRPTHRPRPAARLSISRLSEWGHARRAYSTALTSKRPPTFRAQAFAASGQRPWDAHRAAAQNKGQRREEAQDAAITDRESAELSTTPGLVPSKTALKLELKWLQDPLKFADHIRSLLQKGKAEDAVKAEALLHLKSRDAPCTVGWNHLIDYYMSRDAVNKAWKAYNDMKKRGQSPDSYTYTIFFSGLADHAHYPNAVSKALSVYHSMFSEKSQTVPVTLHTNAVLQVCARAKDMDALWGIVAKIPESGPGAADRTTYTTILNAIRHSVLGPKPESKSEIDDSAERRRKAIIDGRRIWDDIVAKWRAAEILIDEPLVGAMGRLLLISDHAEDWDDILSLVQQTMDIRRRVPRLGTSERKYLAIPYLPLPRDEEASEKSLQTSQFDSPDISTQASASRRNPDVVLARPSNETLALLLDACVKMAAKEPAYDYFYLLTKPEKYGITPDVANILSYLRVLRISRSSADALRLLRDEMTAQSGALKDKRTYRIAMSVCARDRKNPSALKHAGEILDLMQNNVTDLPVAAVDQYLELACMDTDGKEVVDALNKLAPVIANLKSLLNYGNEHGNKLRLEEQEQVVQVVRKTIALCDRLMLKGEVPKEDHKPLTEMRSELSAYDLRWSSRITAQKMASGREKATYSAAKRELRTAKRTTRRIKQKMAVARKRGEGL